MDKVVVSNMSDQEPSLNQEGGLDPQNAKDMAKSKKVDLITLPMNVLGTNCGNCKFINEEKNFCTHDDVQLPVTERMCCALWDNEGVKRPWKKDE